jgi:flagellar protein FlbD
MDGEAMILLTRLNGSTFAVNPDLIERIQESPDTSVVLVDGTSYIVTESVEEIIDEVAGYRARVLALAHAIQFESPAAPQGPVRRLGAVGGAPRRPVDTAPRAGRS